MKLLTILDTVLDCSAFAFIGGIAMSAGASFYIAYYAATYRPPAATADFSFPLATLSPWFAGFAMLVGGWIAIAAWLDAADLVKRRPDLSRDGRAD